MNRKGKSLYRICKGKYPNHGATMNVGRFYSWNCADAFLKAKLGRFAHLRHKLFTIIDDNEIPF